MSHDDAVEAQKVGRDVAEVLACLRQPDDRGFQSRVKSALLIDLLVTVNGIASGLGTTG